MITRWGRATSFLQLSLNLPRVAQVNDSLANCAAESCPQPELCPLNRVKAGTAVRIKQLSAAPDVSHRLREMGFCEEQQIKLVSQHVNVICQVCNARLGISRQLAETILVETLPASPKLLQVA
jgi:ferrous iron transport protein A